MTVKAAILCPAVCTSDAINKSGIYERSIRNVTKELNACTDGINTWMTENQLTLNDDKTEALLFSFSSSLKPSTISLPGSITLGSLV